MKIGSVDLPSPFVVAPMAGMTDTAFRRLVKRHGGCGLVVTEMVQLRGAGARHRSHARVRRVHRGRAAGLDPDLRRRSRRRWPTAAQIVEGMGADIVDVNMGCPVPKIAKHNAGCSLMREPAHAASVIAAMAKAVKIPVTVKMRAGWNDARAQRARRWRGWSRTPAPRRSPCTAARPRSSYSGSADWDLVARIAERADDSGVRQRRLRRAGADRRAAPMAASRACSSAAACCATRGFSRRPPTWPPAVRLGSSRWRSAASSCSTTSTCS